ncbi:MAG: hypothetical protein MUO31_10040, partial [Thermodesulfovibrionales bacterium]|nr:hypothetical protein [Thermodesulfovibrionales bacterium]
TKRDDRKSIFHWEILYQISPIDYGTRATATQNAGKTRIIITVLTCIDKPKKKEDFHGGFKTF